MWTKTHLPLSHDELVGNRAERAKIVRFLREWPGTEKRALLLYGAVGIGKTAAIHLIANEMGLEIVEMNASDFRSKDEINAVLLQAAEQAGLFGMKRLILIEEVDCMAQRDRGGAGAIVDVIKKSRHPVILTANGIWENKAIRPLHSCCELLEFRKPDVREVSAFLSAICKKEGVTPDRGVLEAVASRCGGDVRAAMHDLRSIGAGRKVIRLGDLDVLGNRDMEKNVFDVLKVIFKTGDCRTARGVVWESEKPQEELVMWIESNIPVEYSSPEEIARAYDWLSRSDVFRGRIIRRQNWGLLSYSAELMSAGVALAKKSRRQGFVRYQPPAWRRGIAEAGRSLSEKIKKYCHVSARSAMREYGFLLFELSRNGRLDELRNRELFEPLEKDEIEFIENKGKAS